MFTVVYILLSVASLLVLSYYVGKDKRAVLAALAAEPKGLTAKTIAEKSGVKIQKVWPILIRLKDDGDVDSYDVRSIRLYKLRKLL